MRPIRSVSVLMPTWQGMEFLERVLGALAAQRLDLPWELVVVDSGSTDGTWELVLHKRGTFPVPLRAERIHKVEFDHGDTRNLLAALGSGDLLVYLTQDAIPSNPDWLARVVANFADERVAAVTCRNVPRPDADLLTKVFSRDDPGYAGARRETRIPSPEAYARASPEERRQLYSFNDVASALRRELWELHPFPRTDFGEDILLARTLLEAGWTVVYDAAATVEHSHDYDEAESYRRGWIDGRFNAEWLDRVCITEPRDVELLTARLVAADAAVLAGMGVEPERRAALVERASSLRRATIQGLHDGGTSTRRRPPTRVLARPTLSILYVVHGFPPDTWAGTEVYTLNLAREMARRGHRVTILARAPADARELPDFHVEDTLFEGLRVLRMTHRLAHPSVRASYLQPQAEAAFARVLDDVRPEVVHFQHLIHLSVGMVEIARDRGLATVITCHDYWALCARVQLIRPGGAICSTNMQSGCFACIKEQGMGLVELAARASRGPAGEILLGFAREVADSGWARAGLSRRAREFVELREREDIVPAAYAAADLRISPSRFLREKLLATGRFDPHAFVFSDNGMRIDHVRALEKRPDPDGRVRFGFVGSLVWYKGGEVLVRAMQRLPASRAVLHVYGDFRPEHDEHHAKLAELADVGGGAPVVFHGRFDNSRLPEVYAEIDVLVVPSLWYENSPITIHEAFLTRTPVIASGIGGMAEYVRDGIDGLHFRVGDEQDLAATMRRFLDEPELLERLSRDFPRVKTIEENAAEMEFRYRGLAAIVRESAASGRSVEYRGDQTAGREGPVEVQGGEWLLIRPGGAAEYDLSPLGSAGSGLDLDLELVALGAEREVEIAGRVLLDGDELGRIEPFRTSGVDETRHVRMRRASGRPPRRLRLESRLFAGGPSGCLRVARVAVAATADAGRDVSPALAHGDHE